MKAKTQYRLNIRNYSDNAAKKFSLMKLIVLTVISIFLTTALIVVTIKEQYQQKALLFSLIALAMIVGYTILNIIALFKKINKR